MLKPKHIDLQKSENYVLSIRIKPSEFMFSISNPKIGKNYYLKDVDLPLDISMLENVKDIIFENKFLTQKYIKTNVILVSQNYSMIPLQYFEEKRKDVIHNFIRTERKEHVISHTNEELGVASIFPLEEEAYNFLTRNLYNPHFEHHSSCLMRFFGEKAKAYDKEGETKVFLNFQNDMLDVLFFEGVKFKHCLSFKDSSPSNHIYYILNLWEKAKFDQQKDELYMYGEYDKGIIHVLQEYIKNISTIDSPSEIHLWGEDALKAPLDLLELAL